jgi:hypothetical protein
LKMIILQGAVLLILFLVELAALAAFGYWGFHIDTGTILKFVLGIGTPLLVAIFWGTFVAPKASISVSEPVRLLLQLTVFTFAAIALYSSEQHKLAITFAIVALIDPILVYMIKA